METLWQDVKYGARMLLKNRGVTLAAVLTLALGIGANTAVFSIVNTVMLRPLPFPESERLVRIWESAPQRNWPTFAVSQPNFLDWRAQNRSFERLAATTGSTFNLTGSDEPERIPGISVTVDFLPVLGITPLSGRNFLPEEDAPGGNNRAVLMSHGLWQRRFGSDPAIVGKTISLNEQSFTVVGVLPARFRWGTADLFAPLAPSPTQPRGDHRLSVIGRLKPGVTLEQASAEMVTIAKQLEQQYPASNGGWTVFLRSFYDWLIPEATRETLAVLLGAVTLVLLTACANVANLLLARSTARHREIAIRVALGAGSERVVRQLLTEAVLLAVLGGALGLLFAFWGVDLVRTTSAGTLPRVEELSLDRFVLLFTLGVSVLTGILFGLAPALQSARADLNETLKEFGRSAAGGARQRTRSALVVTEVALSLVLLIGAGLLLRSFWELLQVQPGYDTNNLLTANISLPNQRYPSRKEFLAFQQQLLERLRAVPGVKAAAAASGLPMGAGGTSMEVHIAGRQPGPGGQQPSAQWRLITPGYFETLRIPLLRGRDLNSRDVDPATGDFLSCVISEEMARRNWPDEDAVGRQFRPWAVANRPLTIVGVVGNVRNFGLESDPDPVVYMPYDAGVWNPMLLVMRTEGEPAAYAGAFRSVVRALDANLPVAAVRSMNEMLEGTLATRRFNMYLLGIFASVALVLSAVGLAGVMAYVVSRRTHEIGLRMALGAQRGDIFRLVVGRGMLLALFGIAVGAAGALALTRLMSGMLFGIQPRDPLTFAATALVLTAVALLACWIPARRATRIDPMVALRYE